MSAYYNEIDPQAAAWLRELIKHGHIAQGDVDERSIEDVVPTDLRPYTQHHFFAGIGGWSYALRLARWPDDKPVWTGSCPCQPFSPAGKGEGFADERHLWPAWFHLIRELRPSIVLGEQVDKATAWLDLVQSDMEGEGYALGAAVIGAHSVGAPHIRQRIYFVADSNESRLQRSWPQSIGAHWQQGRRAAESSRKLVHADSEGRIARIAATTTTRQGSTSEPAGSWMHPEWVACRDGKSRPVEPGSCALAHGVPGRVGLLRGYGNAIVPQVAAEVIKAYMSAKTV